MKKFIIGLLWISQFLFIVQVTNALAMDVSNKDLSFAEVSTIKTWLADNYHDDNNLVIKVKGWVNYYLAIQQKHVFFAKGLRRPKDFSWNFHTFPAIELPFLQQVKQIAENKKNIITLEIAAARGYVSWKVPLAFNNGGTHYANDITPDVINELKQKLPEIYRSIGKPDLMEHIRPVEGSCLDLLMLHPELKNNVDVIYVQKLEKFLNPKQHQDFLFLIETLLAPGGYAFLCTDSDNFLKKSYHMKDGYLQLLTAAQSENSIYPAFVQFDKEMRHDPTINKDREKYFNIQHPENDVIECGRELIKANWSIYGEQTFRLERNVFNYFTPEIYQQAIAHATKLEIVDTFFMDEIGLRTTEKNMASLVGVIVKKL